MNEALKRKGRTMLTTIAIIGMALVAAVLTLDIWMLRNGISIRKATGFIGRYLADRQIAKARREAANRD